MSFNNSNSSHGDGETVEQQHERKLQELKVSLGPSSGLSHQYSSDACLRRYLEARSWNVQKSKKMLEETLRWRSIFKPEVIHRNEVEIEGETEKVFRGSFYDGQGRTVLILRPGLKDTKSLVQQMKHLVYVIENAILNLREGQEQMAWVIDFTGWSLLSMNANACLDSVRGAVSMLQNHYPERLAVAYLCSPPLIFDEFWKKIKHSLDPKTLEKVIFAYPRSRDVAYPRSRNVADVLREYFDVEHLPTEFGGNGKLHYYHQ
ncbi:phosphatidylinositol transfer protein 3-like [Salvia divinorum]|uniref:Phosphatidylinositol transfer protein 3-like n=1 Tax=Salvia divinorum TaxID=28513 RepID=A0ABD1HIB1_SALDI